MTPKDFTRYVLCKVTEDIEKNFDKYASTVEASYSSLTDSEKAKVNEWKHKYFVQLNKFLHKEDFNNG